MFCEDTSPKTVFNNNLRAVIIYMLRTVALLCATGPLMQTFLGSVGFSERHIYIHATVFQAINVITILLCSRFADTDKLILRSALVQIPAALLFLCYLPICVVNGVDKTVYVYLLVVSVMQSVSLALHTVCEYKMPYYIHKICDYGVVSSVCGIVSSLASLGVSRLMGSLAGKYSYTDRMRVAFIISCAIMLIAAILQFFQKSLLKDEEKPQKAAKKEKIPLSKVLSHEAFSHLFVGNFARGFANGTTTVLATAALSIGYGESLTTAMVSVQSVTTLIGCFVFGVLSKHVRVRYTIFFGCLCFLGVPFLLVPNAPALYLTAFAIVFFGKTLVDYAIPTALLYVVPAQIAGTYNAWRMILLNGGTVIATVIAGFIPLPVLFAITTVCQLITGANYFFARIMKENKEM